jgi:hypothetical protein
MNQRLTLASCALVVAACGGTEVQPARDPSTQTTSATFDASSTRLAATPSQPTAVAADPSPRSEPPSTATPMDKLAPPANDTAATMTSPGPPPDATKLTAEIRRGIAGDASLSVAARSVMVTAVRGRVTLRGMVNSEHERSKVELHTRRTRGVTDVNNQIEVKR